MHVVAEGIEDQEAEDLLREFGCNIGQGYFFSRPVSADMLDYWLQSQPVQAR
jgi:EAL domain-containing protein (putative c-di-GMP-specific phosphodiesterase class I)